MTTVALDDLVVSDAPICYGILMPGPHVANGVPVIKVRDIENDLVDAANLQCTNSTIDAQYARSRLRAGDILLSIRGTTGRVAIVPAALDGANITQDTARIRVPAEMQRYVYHMLRSAVVQRQITLHTVGQAVKGINIASVRKLKLPWFPARIRESTSHFLDSHDAVSTHLRALIQQKQRFRAALMRQLLTGRKRFPEFAECDADVVTLSDVCEIHIGGTPRRDTKSYWATTPEEGLPWASISDLRSRWVSETTERITLLGAQKSNTKLVRAGTVLMSFKLTIGRVARAARDIYTNEAIAAIVPREERVVTEYLAEVLPIAVLGVSPDTAVKGVTLNKAKLADIQLRLPCLEEQLRIAGVGELLHRAIETHEEVLSLLEKEKRALMQRLLSGDIPDLDPAA